MEIMQGYRKLDGSVWLRGHEPRMLLRPGPGNRKRFWIKNLELGILKLIAMPSRLLAWLRGVYVKMMLAFAESCVIGSWYGRTTCGHRIDGKGKIPLKDFDEKLGRHLARRRSGYERLDGSGRRGVVLESGSGKKRRLWRVKRKVGIMKLDASPKRFFAWLRGAYVKMMLGFESRVSTGCDGPTCPRGIGQAGRVVPLKEYDKKMILKIHNTGDRTRCVRRC
ncbi:hypothetical protein HS088_TW06G00061 [Tripterygium wilfordii]|uniref:Uncharacterized protein n=1 Tax=Tripterygium wilfordii TaxID=458696 RepID=A0A7J7DIL4_TRIWF|nr:hypothetical protein HS088_TW06G00061 [Tripterygium wilfordii]